MRLPNQTHTRGLGAEGALFRQWYDNLLRNGVLAIFLVYILFIPVIIFSLIGFGVLIVYPLILLFLLKFIPFTRDMLIVYPLILLLLVKFISFFTHDIFIAYPLNLLLIVKLLLFTHEDLNERQE